MAEILPKHIYIATIFFVFAILGGLYMINEMIQDKPDFLSSGDADELEKFNESFNKLEDINRSVHAIQENIQTKPDEGLLGKFGMLGGLINSAWNTIVFMFVSLSFLNSAFYALEDTFGIPSWVPVLLVLVFIVIIAFGILKMIFKAEV